MKINKKKIILLLAACILPVVFTSLDLQHYLSFEVLALHKQQLQGYTQAHFLLAAMVYLFVYTLVFALALPVGVIMTLAGGAIFGLVWGVVLVSFASTLGSTLAFLLARFLLRDWATQKFSQRIAIIDQGIQREGAFYLFALRVVPLFPPALINLAMGLTHIKTWTFYWVSQIGMLAGTVVYINAGTELGRIEAGQKVLTPTLIMAFALLAVFPFIAKGILGFISRRRIYAAYKKPKIFDTNLVVIGAGSGGLVSAYIAAMLKAKVTLIEKEKMGGDCLNTGCVPSKAFIRSANVAHTIRRASEFGLEVSEPVVDFAVVMERVQNSIMQIEPHDSVERYTELGVECLQGEAKIISPYAVQVSGRKITTKNIIIATGGKPKMLDIDGSEKVPVYTSDTIWSLREQPKKLLVIGAGAISCELAQAFSRLGSEVIILTHGSQILSKEDVDVSALLQGQFEQEGITLLFNHKPLRCVAEDNVFKLLAEVEQQEVKIPFTHLLMAVGREANTKNIGLSDLGIVCSKNGEVKVDAFLRTQYPNIYAVGDAAGPYQFTHAASHQAWYAVVNALFGRFKLFKVDYSIIPRATFTSPEIACVGLTEHEAKVKEIEYEITRYDLDDLDRAIVDGDTQGFIKVLTPKPNDKIIGVTIVGSHASELINEFIAVMKRGGRLNDIMNTIHIYPTFSEANKFVAGEWKKKHKPEKLLSIVEWFNRRLRR